MFYQKKLLNGALCVLPAVLACSIAQASETIFDLSTGPRLDEFHWSIAANTPGGTGPNILSELTWRSVDSVQLNAGIDSTFLADFRVLGHISYGNIYDGRVEDADYMGDNRTGQFSLAEAETDGDDLFDLSLAIGKTVVVTDAESTSITPMLGFSYHQQNFEISNGVQLVDTFGTSAGQPIDGLRSSYKTEWWSTFLGLQLDHKGNNWDVYGRVEYHNLDYEGKGNWNLRSDLAHPVSFKHKADGSGPVYLIGARYKVNPSWSVTANLTWWNWDSDNGSSRTYMADGSVQSTRLNTAQWENNSILLGVTYQPADF